MRNGVNTGIDCITVEYVYRSHLWDKQNVLLYRGDLLGFVCTETNLDLKFKIIYMYVHVADR